MFEPDNKKATMVNKNFKHFSFSVLKENIDYQSGLEIHKILS